MATSTNGKSPISSATKHQPEAPDSPDSPEADDELVNEAYDRGEAPCPDAPALIMDLFASCHRMVAAAIGVPLDSSSDTLSILDHYVQQSRGDVLAKPDVQAVLERSIGAYFGEMVRQTYGGYWHISGEADTWRLRLSSVFLQFNPVGIAREALVNDHADGWHAHTKVEKAYEPFVKARLDAFGDVDADEFFLPSSRWDALEVVVAAARERMVHDQEADGFFEESDYEDEEEDAGRLR